MENEIYYNETTTNNKIQLVTNLELNGRGIKRCGGLYVFEFKGEIFKRNNYYWVTLLAFEKIQSTYNLTRVCF